MSELDIAAIIVSYRCAPLTIEALRSLQGEHGRPGLRLRAVVVDNASGDAPQIEQAVRQHGWSSWVTLLEAPRNGGFAYGNNLGIECASRATAPSYVYLLNPDAQVRPGAIETLAHFLETHPSAGIAGSSFENLDGSDWPIAFRFPTLLSELDQGLGIGVITRLLRRWVVAQRMSGVTRPIDWICGASMLIRPAVLEAIGGFDENYFLYYEETDFCRRALRAGFSTWYVPESRVMHISGQSTRVTERTGRPKRFPSYWFASRRRYFASAYGMAGAMVIDLIAIAAHALGVLKRLTLRRTESLVPYFVRDLIRHSILWPQNRSLPPVSCGALSAGGAANGAVSASNAANAAASMPASGAARAAAATPVAAAPAAAVTTSTVRIT